jgi:hypothetical protein
LSLRTPPASGEAANRQKGHPAAVAIFSPQLQKCHIPRGFRAIFVAKTVSQKYRILCRSCNILLLTAAFTTVGFFDFSV